MMTRTEADLQAALDDVPVNASAQARLQDWIATVGTTQAIVGTTQAIVGTTQAIVGTTQVPVGTTQAPVGTTQAPAALYRPAPARRWVPTAALAVAAVALVIALPLGVNHYIPRHRPPIAAAPIRSDVQMQPTLPSGQTVPLTPQAALQTLIDLLPRPGAVTSMTGRLAGGALAEMVYDDGHGAAKVAVGVLVGAGWVCLQPTQTTTCSSLPDGSKLSVYQDFEYPAQQKGATEWLVAVLRPDNVQIQISEWNAPSSKDSPTSRATPPFSISELTTIATNPLWTTMITPELADRSANLFTS
jgi:hypothetical protein